MSVILLNQIKQNLTYTVNTNVTLQFMISLAYNNQLNLTTSIKSNLFYILETMKHFFFISVPVEH